MKVKCIITIVIYFCCCCHACFANPIFQDSKRGNVSALVLLGEWFGDAYFPLKQEIDRRGWTMQRVGVDIEYRGCYNKKGDIVLRSDILISDLKDFSGFDCLIIPSGPQWRKFNQNPQVLQFIRDAHATGLLIASFCVGNRTVIAAGLVDASDRPNLEPAEVTLVKERILLGPRGGGPPPGDGFKSAPIKELCDAIDWELKKDKASNTACLDIYLGQKPPGMTPEVFAPGIISSSDFLEYCLTFSPDGREIYFNRSGAGVFVCRLRGNGWSAPEKPEFAKHYQVGEVHITPDGKRMLVNRYKGLNEGEQGGIWELHKIKDDWGNPKLLIPFGMRATSTYDGTIYTTDISGNEKANSDRARIARYTLLG
jgi:hypothetical protein